jgi:DNA-binding CsgD family transcriptional regulator
LARGIGGGRFGESLDATLGMLAAVQVHGAKARDHFAKARASLDRGSLLSLRAVVDLQDARVLGALGDVEGWRAQLEEARRRFDALGMVLWSERAARLQAAGPPAKYGNPHAAGPDGLSPREMEILGKLAAGGSAKAIASELSLSVATVQRHVANIYTKIGVNSRVAATAYAFKHRIGGHQPGGKGEAEEAGEPALKRRGGEVQQPFG